MTKRTAKREQFLADILTTAVEGGINSWAVVDEYKHEYTPVPVAETYAIIEDAESNDFPPTKLTIDVIAHGIGVIKAMDYQPNYFGDGGSYWRQFLLADRTNGDDGDYDAIVADWIVQAGIFGEIIYS